MTQVSDAPTLQSAAARWTFYRRLGLLLRTRLDAEGATRSLAEIAARTRGRVSAHELAELLAQGPLAQPDAVTCILLAQAFDVDPDFFVTDEAVHAYIRALREAYRRLELKGATSLQAQALAIAARPEAREEALTR